MSGTYNVDGVLPNEVLQEVPDGSNIGIVGPSMSGKRELALEFVSAGYQSGGGILCITTDSAETIYRDLERHVDSLNRDRVGIVDTTGSDGQELLDAMIENVSSPGDLTGISVGTAKLFKEFENRGISNIRYGLISISTLLQYLESERVFKFVHVYTKRIEKTDGLGIYTLDNDSHDEQVINTITGVFDGVIELQMGDDGELEFRLRGFGSRPMSWTKL